MILKIIFFVIIAVFGAWIAFLIFLGKGIYKFQKRQEKKSQKSQEEMYAILDKMTQKLSVHLKKWSKGDLEKMTFNQVKSFRVGKFYTQKEKGIFCDTNGEPKIALALIDNSTDYTKAITRIKTTAFMMELFYDDKGFRMEVDGQSYGVFRKDNEGTGRIFNNYGEKIGVIQRNMGDINRSSIDLIFKEIKLYYKNDNRHHSFGFSSGFQGEMTNTLSDEIPKEAFKFHQNYSTEEEKWLIALMVHEKTVNYSDYVIDYDD